MGYERLFQPRLLFLHNRFQRHSCRRARAGLLATSLTPGRVAFDGDDIDRAARPVVVESTNRQSPGPPGQRVQVGSAVVKQWAVGIIVMAVDDMESAKAARIALR